MNFWQTVAATKTTAAADFHTKAVDFDGSTEGMANQDLGTLGVSDVWSWEFWAKPAQSTPAATGTFFSRGKTGTNNNRSRLYQLTAGTLFFQLYNSSGTVFKQLTTTTTLTGGNIYHIVITYDGSDTGDPVKLYINGSEDTTWTGTDNTGTQTDTSDAYGIGCFSTSSSTSTYFEGEISSVQIYSSVLDSTNITALYDSGNGYKKDKRNDFGNYDQSANLVHQWALGKQTGSASLIGTDYVSSGTINMGTDAVNIADADVVTF